MPSTSCESNGKSGLYLLLGMVSALRLRADHTIFSARFGQDRSGRARFDGRTELVGERGGGLVPVAADDVQDPAAIVARGGLQLPVRDRGIGGIDDVVEHRRR